MCAARFHNTERDRNGGTAEARPRVMGFAGSDAGANRAESRAPRNRIHASPKPANTICS